MSHKVELKFLHNIYIGFTWTDFFDFQNGGWKCLVMIAVGIVLIWLAIKKEYEPSLLLPMGFVWIMAKLGTKKD